MWANNAKYKWFEYKSKKKKKQKVRIRKLLTTQNQKNYLDFYDDKKSREEEINQPMIMEDDVVVAYLL